MTSSVLWGLAVLMVMGQATAPVGIWNLRYTNGHTTTYRIAYNAAGSHLYVTSLASYYKGRTSILTYQTSGPFKGYWKGSSLHRAGKTWEYYKLAAHNTLHVYHFCNDGCGGHIWNVGQYCCSATGVPAADPHMIGVYNLKYTNGHTTTYEISWANADRSALRVTSRASYYRGRSVVLQYVASGPFKGWFIGRGLHRPGKTWELFKVTAVGQITVHHFCNDGCGASLLGQGSFCCTAKGVKTADQRMLGAFNLKYSNGHTTTYKFSWGDSARTIVKMTSLASYYKGRSTLLKLVTTGPLAGWFLGQGVHRAGETWEYYKITVEGTLLVRHFCRDGCGATLSGLGQYCCSGVGTRSSDPNMLGIWNLKYSNGHATTYQFSVSPTGVMRVTSLASY